MAYSPGGLRVSGGLLYVRRLSIKNIRALSDCELSLTADECAGWHVLLGENGSGKSTCIRALATVLMGAVNAHASRQDWSNWLRVGESSGSVEVLVEHHDEDQWVGKGNTATQPFAAGIEITRNGNGAAPAHIEFSKRRHASRTVWGDGDGWFSASFGPFRRFLGGDPDVDRLYYSHPRLAPHLSALGEQVALGETLRWLRELQTRALEGDELAAGTKQAVVDFVNGAELLPHGAYITDVSSTQVTMIDGQGARVAIEEMSDGYRSVLSMTMEILRLMSHVCVGSLAAHLTSSNTVRLPGVVAIDEIDAHLHPNWQTRIGEWFVSRFPETQFLVTTHSPIICRAATSVWKLPSPGSFEVFRRVADNELARLVDGNILDAYATNLFGESAVRSARSVEKAQRLAELSQKRLHQELTIDEEADLRSLRLALPTTPMGDSSS